MGTNYNPRMITDGIVLCLDAANSKSYSGTGTTWKDLSGNNNNGTLTNGPTFNSANGGSIVFDGINDFADISNTSIGNFGTSNFSTSFWAKASSGSTGTRGVFSKYNPHSGPGTGWFMFCWDGVVWVRITQDLVEPREYLQFYISVTVNQWVNAVMTRNANNFSLYINGLLHSTGNSTNIIDCSSEAPLRVGSGYSSGYYFSGDVSNAQIYNRVLSAQEIFQNFNAIRGRFGI